MKTATSKAFEELGQLVRQKRLKLSPATHKPLSSAISFPENLSDAELFEFSMKDVVPLGWSAVPSLTNEPIEIQNPQQSEDEGLRLLTEFVEGKGVVDLLVSGEYIEGSPHPRGHLLLEDLRTGHFAVQAHLDLHGLTAKQAKERFDKFIRRSLHLGHGCIRIIHGRGHHSMDGEAVLKEHVQKWLNSRRMSRQIIAYTSARLCDGGGGALYVLLRRRLHEKGGITQ
jgi:DNA-nicking Smr family endonuclease